LRFALRKDRTSKTKCGLLFIQNSPAIWAGFIIQNSRFKIQNLGFRVQDSGFKIVGGDSVFATPLRAPPRVSKIADFAL
ncbi:MAG: hypothetical protein IKJ12_07055, partial [Rikenellaceae bacterium]|nr:hypothetical protein [Rikenellaceae bacterium]